eukprot:COSAG01_NODE_26260_length_719_cov_2.629032_1_plen_110_part_00
MELTAGNLSRLRALAANSKSVQGVLFSARSESSSVEIVEKALHLPPATTWSLHAPVARNVCSAAPPSPPGISPGLLAATPPRPAGVHTQPTRPSATRRVTALAACRRQR